MSATFDIDNWSQEDLDALDDDYLLAIVRAKRALAKKRQKAAAPLMKPPPLPPYACPQDASDQLAYEYGMELAFRPKGHPDNVDQKTLVPLLYVPETADTTFISSLRGNKKKLSALKAMFGVGIRTYAEHIGAKLVADSMSTYGETEIEFPSPVMTRMSQIEWYYKLIRGVVDGIGATVETEKENSGGGHLHVSPISWTWTDWHVFAVTAELINNPWIPWMFNDPDDHTTAVSPASIVGPALHRWNDNERWWDYVDFIGENTAMRTNDGGDKLTMEFRFFQAPHNWEEQRLHVLFLERWLSQVLANPKKEVPKAVSLQYMFPQELMAITPAQADKEFKKLMKRLELNEADYQPFVDRNMRVRYAKGWVRN